MKNIVLSVAVIIAIGFTSCKSETKKETKTITKEVITEIASTDLAFGVRGNCVMCKKTIEKAATSVEGVVSASWDVAKKNAIVSFDDSKTNAMEIHNAIAEAGYDTEKMAGNKEAYKNLPGCCQYDHEMLMSQLEE
jgi:copper chaperone CopZ